MPVFVFQLHDPQKLDRPQERLQALIGQVDPAAAAEVTEMELEGPDAQMSLAASTKLSMREFWEGVQGGLGADLSQSMIVVASHDGQFEDYFLAHHFDPSEPLDRLPGPARRAPSR